ncbi:RNA polymerase sigma factor region1.1 domain-containing protein [Methylobacterium sp. ID0610]|uniref:RNA polymerase sigma factor region1.1 domain-containing protein n=1 Tax=Methylobacterium carpenticola TaxID=3344827 RepID=UPI0036C56063
MQPAIDRASLDRLIARGRAQGQLTTEDLRRDLPISGMSPDAIALLLVELEEAGVPVELEEELLAPGRPVRSALPPAAALPRQREAAAGPPPAATASTSATAAHGAAAPSPAATEADKAVILAGIVAVAVGLLIAVALGH